MASTDWIQALKVVELKEELKKRGQPVAGKKAELIERLEAYINENEKDGSGAPENTTEEAAALAPAAEEPAAEIVEETPTEAPAEASARAPAEPASPPAVVKEKPELIPASAQKEAPPAAVSADADADAAPHDVDVPDVDVDYEESDGEEPAAAPASVPAPVPQPLVVKEQPQKEEIKPVAEETKLAPIAAPAAAAKAHPAPLFAAAISTIKQPDQPASAEASRKRPAPDAGPSAPLSGAAARPEKAPRVGYSKSSVAQVVESHPSRALLIEGFVRPFTLNQARELLCESGTVIAMWMPTIKNLAYVVFAKKAEAVAAKTVLKDLQWPAGSPKTLQPMFVSLATAEAAIGTGAGNTDFKVERTEEDGPEDDVIASVATPVATTVGKAGKPVAAKGQPQQVPQENTEVGAPRAALEGVTDLRELLSKRREEAATAPQASLEHAPPRDQEMAPAPAEARPALEDVFKKTSAQPAIYWVPKKPFDAVEVPVGRAGANAELSPAPTH